MCVRFGIPSYEQEAYGSVSASADTVTVTEDDYWSGADSLTGFSDPFRYHYGVF